MSGEGRRHVTTFHPMCGSFSPLESRRTTSPGSSPRPVAPPCSTERSNSSCMPRHSPITGTPAPARSRTSSSRPGRAQPPHRLGERAHARHDEAVGPGQDVVVAGQPGVPADALEGLLDRAAVAHAVVEDPDHAVRVPFVDGTPASVGSIVTAARRARANALKAASMRWCAFVPASSRRCSVSRAVLATRAHELLGQLVLEPSRDAVRDRHALPDEQRAAGDVERARRARLVHRHDGVAVADDPRPVAERLRQRLAEHQAGVLDRVVRAGLQVAADVDVEVQPAVAREQVEHVVEEADARAARAQAGAVERERRRGCRSRRWCG